MFYVKGNNKGLVDVSDSVNWGIGTAKGTRKPIRLDCL